MELNENAGRGGDLADLAVLDPAAGREPSPEEWIRARAAVDRMIAPGEPADARARPRPLGRRFALVGAVAAVAAAGVVVVPALLPSTAEKASAAWTPEPSELTGSQVLPLARECAEAWEAGAPGADDVIVAERRGVASLLIMQRGAGSAECLSLDSHEVTAWMGLTEGPGATPPDGTVTIETMSSVGEGRSQYSNVVGRVGASVVGIDLVMPDGEVIRPSVRAGWWAAWWPGPEGGEVNTFRVVVHTAAGDSAFVPGQLFAAR
ncbi:hypothetical protein AB0J86_29075 [Micromonospora sp. NPDC049559]|uniref:hypothetical protein n=1 Tax=Micromonospora sp. NPDC049559 TaxID=3155923 RepID=UPI003448260B